MVFKRFYLFLLGRITVLAINALLTGYFIFRPEFLFTSVFLSVVFIIQVADLILFLNRTNTRLATFMQYLENDDPRMVFRGNSAPDKHLNRYFSQLSTIITNYRSREKRWQYLLDYTIENLDAGIIVLAAGDNIEKINKPARIMLSMKNETTLSSITDADPGLVFLIRSITPGQRKIYKLRLKDEYRQLLLRASTFRLFDDRLKLVYMQDIRSELQDKELDSWQKLIRVITHEVNNTLSPVTSLTSLLLCQLTELEADGITGPQRAEICRRTVDGLRIINERNAGLLKFVSEFRSSALPPQISPVHFRVDDLVAETGTLFAEQFSRKGIQFIRTTEPVTLTLFADRSLLAQVLVNLVKNAIECFEGSSDTPKEIRCFSRMDEEDHVVIDVADNGPGIPGSIVDRIFIPFFTTREGGSGIGLSFSRQVIRKHHGSIDVFSQPGKGSRFIIKI